MNVDSVNSFTFSIKEIRFGQFSISLWSFRSPSCLYLPSRKQSCGKVMFSQVSVEGEGIGRQHQMHHGKGQVGTPCPSPSTPSPTPTPPLPPSTCLSLPGKVRRVPPCYSYIVANPDIRPGTLHSDIWWLSLKHIRYARGRLACYWIVFLLIECFNNYITTCFLSQVSIQYFNLETQIYFMLILSFTTLAAIN